MKNKLIWGVVALFLLGSCTSKSAHHEHDGHGHETTEHTHNHEGHNHDEHNHEGHNHNHEGHNHSHEGHSHSHEGHNHDGHNGHEHNPDEIVMSVAKAEAAGVKVGTVQPGVFHQIIRTSGQVLAAQGDEKTVVATVAGVVSFKGKVTEGMPVQSGKALLTISARHIGQGDPVEKAQIAYEVAQKEYERMKSLVSDRIVSEKAFLQAKQAYENARISYEAVAKNHTEGGQQVTAGIGGFVKNLFVKEGDYIEVGQPLMSITQNRRLFLRADVSEKYYPALHNIGSANFCTPYNNKVYELKELNGQLLSYGKSSDGNGYYIPVTFEFDNKGEVIPGSFVEIYLLSTPMEGVLSLPHTALTEEQGSFFVYLQLDKECYKKQLVTLGADNGKEVQVLSGIHAGDKIVTEGAYQVKLAGTANAIPGHSHEH
ncbi:MAG: efflux RND transporter periplasmic adaptor subunit [Mediterranea massiliensis]|nr:efflux RND transporter periplasmic adaptor subunit [Mediterranea massiliensis]